MQGSPIPAVQDPWKAHSRVGSGSVPVPALGELRGYKREKEHPEMGVGLFWAAWSGVGREELGSLAVVPLALLLVLTPELFVLSSALALIAIIFLVIYLPAVPVHEFLWADLVQAPLQVLFLFAEHLFLSQYITDPKLL